jgi:glutamyl-tRNA reductase
LQEFDVLESVLDIFQAGNKREIEKIEHLINDETEELLSLLSSYEIENYACEQFDLISKKWEGDLVDALHDLNYDFS